ncbi:hypothetical protein H0H87_009623 [Tephrocybe sp. NHM501043]|nr:hypothetical protein H0H87_009623 [Tephrocybe sp. NHM501043]
MRFSTVFNLAFVALLASPAVLAQPLAYKELDSRDLALETAHRARELEYHINEMLERRALDGENIEELEARFFPLRGLRMLGKGIGLMKGSSSNNRNK